MIDYVKLYLENVDIGRLLNSQELDFKSEISRSTGEVKEHILEANYHFGKITIKSINAEKPHVIFSGSIHKMWNDLNGINAPNVTDYKAYRGFNGNQFSLNEIIQVRKHLGSLFDCDPNQMRFQNVEFGVNAPLLFSPALYLKGLLYHKNIPFDFSHSGNYAQAIHQFFIFKVYNKSYQYNMTGNVLRVELKIIKMEELKRIAIRTFADIDESSLQNAQIMLLRRFDEITHYDYTIRKTKLSKRQLEAVKNYSNPRYWIYDLKPIHRDRHKKRLKEMTIIFSENLHNQIRINILEKCVMINQRSK